jgi:hypothetical protein
MMGSNATPTRRPLLRDRADISAPSVRFCARRASRSSRTSPAGVPARSAPAFPGAPDTIQTCDRCLSGPRASPDQPGRPVAEAAPICQMNRDAPVARLDRALPSEAGPQRYSVPLKSSLEQQPQAIFERPADRRHTRAASVRVLHARLAPIRDWSKITFSDIIRAMAGSSITATDTV